MSLVEAVMCQMEAAGDQTGESSKSDSSLDKLFI